MTRTHAIRLVIAGSIVLLAAAAVKAYAGAVTPGETTLPARVSMLEAEVQAAEDLQAIKRLQRSYGYYLDKGMWTDLAEYFTQDAVANYPAGVYVGKESIREHLYRNVGNVPMGQVGLGDGRLYNHLSIQPVVHLDADGQGASGRWRALATFGSLPGGATWAEGIYQMRYRKEGGVWKISKLDYYSGFGSPYATGWVAPAPAPAPAAGATPPLRRTLAHPPDRERDGTCDGFASACIAPFHYANPGTAAGGRAWYFTDAPAPSTLSGKALDSEIAALSRRASRLADEQAIENLQRIYGYYYDRAHWTQMADLFAPDATLEFAQAGVYKGPRHIRAYLGTMGPEGGEPGWLNERIQLQPIVTVAPDGRTARSRSRELSMTGHYGQGGEWSEGIYENRYEKRDGKWMFSSVHYYPTFQTDYDQGWGKQARPAAGIDAVLKPDRPPTQVYEIYPKAQVPPFHYRNPVTGQPPVYPAVGGPDAALASASLMALLPAKPAGLKGSIEAALAAAESQVARYKDYNEIENLESAYGYYLDKNLWDSLAGLISRDGTMELAMRGVYSGDRVRGMLWAVFGRGQQGPAAGRLGNHMQLQPVIDIAVDGQTAKARVRMLQQMSQGARASIGGAIYENEFVKEDGVWKISKLATWNTLSAGYDGGWAKSAGRGMPGPSTDYPPDAPPSREVAMFPVVFNIPYHYANPVSGRTEVPALPSIAEQMQRFPVPRPAAPPPQRTAQPGNGE
ncbi:MAG: hypothetical protein RL030_350 [Pseudomonadota bacterium]